MHYLMDLLNQYGYIVLIVALMLELIAFPLPGEVLMTYCGMLVGEHKLNWGLSILMATAGTIIGVTLSYFIGNKLGVTFFKKYGHYVHLDEQRMTMVSDWFNKFGNRLLLITCFIPGVRHVTGYFSGITRISYKEFAINSYIGAFLWTATFISIGKILGPKWEKYHSLIIKYLLIASLIIVVSLVLVYLYKNKKHVIEQKTIYLLERGFKVFHSFGRIKVFMLCITLSFLAFVALVIGLIQDFLANEFSKFDEVVKYLVGRVFDNDWNWIMSLFRNFVSVEGLILVTIISFAFILINGKNKLHEVKFLLYATIGGEILNDTLRLVFHRIGPAGIAINGFEKYTFPSNESMMAMISFGFLTFIIIRHCKRNWLVPASMIISIAIILFIGLSLIYFGGQYPSDVTAGYELGGLWLTLVIILLEVFRVVPVIDFEK